MKSLRALGLVLFSIVAIAWPQKSNAFLGSNMDAVHATLDRFFFQYGGARELANRAWREANRDRSEMFEGR